MKPPLPAVLYGTGLLLAFGAGWFFKPASFPNNTAALSRPALRPGPPIPQKSANALAASGVNWLDAASADVAAVRAAKLPGVVNQVLIDKLKAALDITDKYQRQASWQCLITEMRPEDAIALKDLFNDPGQGSGYNRGAEFASFLHHWGRIDGAAAAASNSLNGIYIQMVTGGWAEKNAAEALAWLDSQAPETVYRNAFDGIIDGMFTVNSPAAEALLLYRAGDPRLGDTLAKAVENRQAREGFDAARQWFAGIAVSDAAEAFKRENFSALVSINNAADPIQKKIVLDLVQPYLNQPWLPANAGEVLGEHWAGTDPVGGFQRMLEMTCAGTQKSAAESLARIWARADAPSLSVWLRDNTNHPQFDLAASYLALTLQTSDPEAARAWAARIKNPDLKSRAMQPTLADPFAIGQ